jgi:hypothetical protein
MKCDSCPDEDSNKCISCTDPERDELTIRLQEILKNKTDRIGGKPIE